MRDLKPFSIANIDFKIPLIQGPLAGFSCSAFRERFYDFLPPAYTCSEMISAADIISSTPTRRRYLHKSAKEGMLCYQISGNSANTLSRATQILNDLGADLIDLNCGCPKPKIRKKAAGSALLDDLPKLAKFIEAMKAVSEVPITVKIRLSDNYLTVAKTIEQAGADLLIVHGRTWQEDYDTLCNYQKIREIVSEIAIPVVANGDVCDKASLENIITQTKCSAVMVSRAATGRPWLYQQLLSDKFEASYQLAKEQFILHIESLVELENDFIALLQSRKLAKYYFRNFLSMDKIESLYKIENLSDLLVAL